MNNKENYNAPRFSEVYFAEKDQQKVAEGLAAAYALSACEDEDGRQAAMWQAFYTLRGEEVKAENTLFLPRGEWLKAAAYSVQTLPGGVVLAQTLRKLAQPERIKKETLQATSPVLARQLEQKGSGAEDTVLECAAKALGVWQEVWQGGENPSPLGRLAAALKYVETHDFGHLPKPVLAELNSLHLAATLCADGMAARELEAAINGILPVLAPFASPRADGLGQLKKRTAFSAPHGYGEVPQGVFKALTEEVVWLESLPVYWQGRLLAEGEQRLLAEERRDLGLEYRLNVVLGLPAYKALGRQSPFTPKGLSRKNALERTIKELTRQQ